MNISEALNVQHRTLSSRDAEVLLASVLGKDRTYLLTHPSEALSSDQVKQFESFLRRREQNEPVAYIVGVKEFYGRPFAIDARALIPRPETEGIVEKAMSWIAGQDRPISILELGTGAGGIAITLAIECTAKHLPVKIIATDISESALELARENAVALGASKTDLKFLAADLFSHPEIADKTFDMIVANLPYVENTWKTHSDAQPDVVFHEPEVALFGGEDGLDIYRRFFAQAPQHLAEKGALFIEHGELQTATITSLAVTAFPNKHLSTHQDYAQLDRVLAIT